MREVVCGFCHLLYQLLDDWNAGDARWALELLLGHIGQALGTWLRARQVHPHKHEKALKLLQGLHGLSSTSAR